MSNISLELDLPVVNIRNSYQQSHGMQVTCAAYDILNIIIVKW